MLLLCLFTVKTAQFLLSKLRIEEYTTKKKAISWESLPEWVALCAEWVQKVFWLLMLTAGRPVCSSSPASLLVGPKLSSKTCSEESGIVSFSTLPFFEVCWDKSGCTVSQPLHRKVWRDNALLAKPDCCNKTWQFWLTIRLQPVAAGPEMTGLGLSAEQTCVA